MSCNPCQAPCFDAPEDFGNLFPSLVGPMGPPGGPGTYVNSLAELRLLNPAEWADGYQVWVAGYAFVNDGGGGFFSFLSTGTDVDNDGTIIAPSSGIGRWFRVYSGFINAKWFGATGAGLADETARIQNALNTAFTGNGDTTIRGVALYLPAGVYVITGLNILRGTRLFGDGPSATILHRTPVTGYGILFDSTGLTPTDVADWVSIKDLSIFQSGTPVSGGGIYINGATSPAMGLIENVRVEDCYHGIVTYNNAGTYLKAVEVYSAVVDGFYFVGGLERGVCIDCYAADCGMSGFYVDMGLSVSFLSCGSDNNGDNGFHFNNTNYSGFYGCRSEGNENGIKMVGSTGNVIDNFFTFVTVNTENAIVLDASNLNDLRNLSSSHQNPAYGTYMVAVANGSVSNLLSIGFQSSAWPSGNTDNTLAFDSIRAGGIITYNAEVNFVSAVLSAANLPTVAGLTGTLWNNSGVVEVAP